MTLNDLIEELQILRDDLDDGDVEVRLAMQPEYPMQHTLEAVEVIDLAWLDTGSGRDVTDDPDHEPERVVYLVEGGQVDGAPYLPEAASETLGWR